MTIYEQLKKAAGMADVIEAAECGYVALDNKSIRHLNNQLMEMILEISAEQFKSSQALQHLRAAKLINQTTQKGKRSFQRIIHCGSSKGQGRNEQCTGL